MISTTPLGASLILLPPTDDTNDLDGASKINCLLEAKPVQERHEYSSTGNLAKPYHYSLNDCDTFLAGLTYPNS